MKKHITAYERYKTEIYRIGWRIQYQAKNLENEKRYTLILVPCKRGHFMLDPMTAFGLVNYWIHCPSRKNHYI